MTVLNSQGGGGGEGGVRMAIDVGRLGVDWEAERRAALSKLHGGAYGKSRHGWMWAYGIAAMAAVFIAAFAFWHSFVVHEDALFMDAVSETEMEDELPAALYVLNGFDYECDFEEFVDFIVPSSDGEEGL